MRHEGGAFDVNYYRLRYSDLQNAYGADLQSYYIHYIKYGQSEGRDGYDVSYESIMGDSSVTVEQMANLYNKTVGQDAYPSSTYSSKGASSIKEFCSIILEEANSEGVRAEVLFAQVMVETGWLKFGGSVKPEQCNFGGLGATSNTVGGASFTDVRTGLRAQTQHLKAYACADELNNDCVDPRFHLVNRGSAPLIRDLNGKWAVPGNGYGESILDVISSLVLQSE